MDFPEYLQSSYPFLCLGDSAGSSSQTKRKRILKEAESDSDSSSDSDDEPDDEDVPISTPDNTSSYRIPKKGKRVWDTKQMENLRKNFKNIEHLDDNVLAFLSFRDISSNEGKKDKQNRVLAEKLAENFDRIRKFAVKVEAGEDLCTERAHDVPERLCWQLSGSVGPGSPEAGNRRS